jgi:hypothetical protein
LPPEPGQAFVPQPLIWDVGPLAAWFDRNAAIALQEEAVPFPLLDETPHAAAWLAESMRFARAPTPQDEDRRWRQCSGWRDRHAPSRAMLGAATPQWTLRRLGDRVELTWDTGPAIAIRPDIRWMAETQGQVYLDGPRTSAVIARFAAHMAERSPVGIPSPVSTQVLTRPWH